jgi:voltage-gated potassium channel
LLIGFTWTFAYQLVVNLSPDAIHFVAGPSHDSMQQPSHLIYYSFITPCTVGYGDAYPVHPVVRSLAVAEALVGQLYLAILIASVARPWGCGAW